MQLAETFILRKMSVQPIGRFTVQPAALELSLSKNYICQNQSITIEKL